MKRGYPPELEQAEREALLERRRAAGLVPRDGQNSADKLVGVGLSGGGIRSATFALGLFQALAQARLIGKIDFLSTVSGGGYFGSFLGRMFTRDDSELAAAGASENESAVARVEQIVANPNSPPMAWLRENGRYLAPNGSGDTRLGAAVILRNWVSIQVVLATFLLMQLTAANFARAFVDNSLTQLEQVQDSWLQAPAKFLHGLAPGLPRHWVWWSPYILLPACIALFGVIPSGWAGWTIPHKTSRKDVGRGIPHLFVVAVLLLISGSLALVEYVIGFDIRCVPGILLLLLSIECLFTLIWAGLAFLLTRPVRDKYAGARNWLDHALAKMFGLTLATFGFALLDSLGQTVYACLRYQQVTRWQWLGVIVAGLFTMVTASQKLPVFFGKPGRRPVKLPVAVVAGIAGMTLASLLMVGLAALAHGAAWEWKIPAGNPGKLIARFVMGDAIANPLEPMLEPPGSGVTEATGRPGNDPDDAVDHGFSTGCLLLWSLVLFGLSLIFGYTWPFLNESSQQMLYNSRITRAYLGASNPRRWLGRGTSVTRVIDGDSISMADYAPHRKGGPLHFINVTLNETLDAKSQVERQDRKGTGMAVGPCGVSVGVRHHAVWYSRDKQLLPPFYDENQFQVFQDEEHTTRREAEQTGRKCKPIDVEPLELGQWVGISGAAVSTGLGATTSLGLSLLAGIFDVRLGYWWNSGIDPAIRHLQTRIGLVGKLFRMLARLFPVQVHLLGEFTARFHGTARKQWYLSDGGHFENMGGYELIRRRLDMIVICDGEQDANFTFSGLANLVRKARTDFGAEIEFFTQEELDRYVDPSVRRCFGTLDQLRRGIWTHEPVKDPATDERRLSVEADEEQLSLAHAALARVRYGDESKTTGAQSILLYIKASLTGDEPADLTNYHKCHSDFPHQSTAEQFFDEAQWESYRRLGAHIGAKIFRPDQSPSGDKWLPSTLDPVPLWEAPMPPAKSGGRESKARAKPV